MFRSSVGFLSFGQPTLSIIPGSSCDVGPPTLPSRRAFHSACRQPTSASLAVAYADLITRTECSPAFLHSISAFVPQPDTKEKARHIGRRKAATGLTETQSSDSHLYRLRPRHRPA
jgi:hypothetical protein